jgi:hypothetical protein
MRGESGESSLAWRKEKEMFDSRHLEVPRRRKKREGRRRE